ncbi:MAG TPA: Na+/H+ antiporter [Acetobacteraceae bacterium]
MSPVQTLELVLFLLAVSVALAMLARRLRIPTAVAFVVGGIVLALTPGLPEFALDPQLTMALFLPPLLMAAAYFTSWREFQANLRAISLLAVGAVAFTTLTVGWVTHALLPSLPWAACLALGAIVSPPDAVAAASVLERLHLPRRLVVVLLGESLVNDASGLVLYRFAVAAALTGGFDPLMATGAFVLVSAAGVAIGLGTATAYIWLAPRLRDTHLEIAGSFLIAWTSYLAAELVHASGVLATVACGILLGLRQHAVLSPRTRTESRAAWGFVVFVLEALVFILLGLTLAGALRRLDGAAGLQLLPVAAAVAGTMIGGRFVWVFIVTPLFLPMRDRGRHGRPSVAAMTVLSWAGMRGVVSLAAALALPVEMPGRDAIIVLTYASILVTVLLQGPTLAPLIQALGLAPPADALAPPPGAQARASVERAALDALEHRADDPIDGAIARDLLPEYRDRAAFSARWTEAGRIGGAALAERTARLGLRLHALEAARQHLLSLHRAGDLRDEELHLIEEELDLEELRLRGRSPA